MVVVDNPSKYNFVKFRKSETKNKKYDAVLQNKETKKYKIVPFGQIHENGEPYYQYKDSTGLGLFSKYNHLDKARRDRYRVRHSKGHNYKFSSQWFSYYFLW